MILAVAQILDANFLRLCFGAMFQKLVGHFSCPHVPPIIGGTRNLSPCPTVSSGTGTCPRVPKICGEGVV